MGRVPAPEGRRCSDPHQQQKTLNKEGGSWGGCSVQSWELVPVSLVQPTVSFWTKFLGVINQLGMWSTSIPPHFGKVREIMERTRN